MSTVRSESPCLLESILTLAERGKVTEMKKVAAPLVKKSSGDWLAEMTLGTCLLMCPYPVLAIQCLRRTSDLAGDDTRKNLAALYHAFAWIKSKTRLRADYCSRARRILSERPDPTGIATIPMALLDIAISAEEGNIDTAVRLAEGIPIPKRCDLGGLDAMIGRILRGLGDTERASKFLVYSTTLCAANAKREALYLGKINCAEKAVDQDFSDPENHALLAILQAAHAQPEKALSSQLISLLLRHLYSV